jgi:hypothetical protein
MEKAMDVKWEKQIVEAGKNGRGRSLVAVLVEDYQDGAQTKIRDIQPLASIKERILKSNAPDMRAFHQGLFWANVDKKLDHLTLNPAERKKIESKISKTVSRPSGDWALWSVTCIPRYDP